MENEEKAIQQTESLTEVPTKAVAVGKKVEGKKRRVRLDEIFTADDARKAASHAWDNYVKPAAKKFIWDTVMGTLSYTLDYDIPRNTRTAAGRVTVTPYDSISTRGSKDYEPRATTRTRQTYQYDDLLFESEQQALEVRDRMLQQIDNSRDHFCSVGDFYEFASVNGSYTDYKWGWYDYDLDNVKASAVNENGVTKWMLRLPRISPKRN